MILIYIELALVVTLAFVAIPLSGFAAQPLARAEAHFSRLARRRGLALLVVGSMVIAMRIAAFPIQPIPEPSIDDEFSYLLQADTYLHGRLTNPTPPMWTHFETFHINMRRLTNPNIHPPKG